MSIEHTDAEAAAIAERTGKPRVSLADMEGKIAARYEFTGCDLLAGTLEGPYDASLEVLSICILVMRNGFTLIGKSAPASPENFDAELGRKLAYEDALRQLWPLEGYALRERLAPG